MSSDRIRDEMVVIRQNGESLDGYLAIPQGEGPFPAVIVIQEWWGLVEHIKDVARRFAAEGYVALAPDLYHGVQTSEPDEAGKLMMALNMDRASSDLIKAVDYLAALPQTQGRHIGVIGFCMGGGLALTLATDSDKVKATADFYGGVTPDPIDRLQNLQGPVFVAFAEHDGWANAELMKTIEEALTRFGKSFETKIYPGTEHAFFNDSRPEVFNQAAASDAWNRVLSHFGANL
jgi:carboxymethylenebutenolidase